VNVFYKESCGLLNVINLRKQIHIFVQIKFDCSTVIGDCQSTWYGTYSY